MKLQHNLRPIIMVFLFPCIVFGQFSETMQSMRYKIVNGQVYFEVTTTEAPSFLETLFPWMGSSYQSVNSEQLDEQIINSVSGPPTQGQSSQNYGFGRPNSGILSLPSFSSYSQSAGGIMNQSPYLTNEEDNYIPNDSINHYQYAHPSGNAPQLPSYPKPNQPYQYGYPNPGYASPYMPPTISTTEKPVSFYQSVLNFFGWGSSEESEEDYGSLLPSPADILNMGSYPSEALPEIPHNQIYSQSRHSSDEGTQFVEDLKNQQESKYSINDGPKPEAPANDLASKDAPNDQMTSKDDAAAANSDNDKFPCPKLGFWQWNGEFCIAVGPIPAWGCKPIDLAISGKLTFCRNKHFFPPGLNPMGK